MPPADNPTTSPALEETAPAAPILLPVEQAKDAPLEMNAFEKGGKVYLVFNKPVDAVNMTPKVARQLIRNLSVSALAADRNKPGKH